MDHHGPAESTLQIHTTDLCNISILIPFYSPGMSRGIVVSIATGDWTAENKRSTPGRAKNFNFSLSSRSALGPTKPPIEWELGAVYPGVKPWGRNADHSPPTTAEVKKMYIYTFTPPYAFIA
jgi:hypothetical protein